VAFTSYTSATNVWTLPLDANRGVVTGAISQLTEGAGPYGRATVANGDVIAYRSGSPKFLVLVRNLKTGETIETGIAGSAYGSAISPDGARVAFEAGGGVSVRAVAGGPTRSLCADCQVGEWTNDSRAVAAAIQSRSGRIVLVDADSGASRDLVVSAKNRLNRPHFSPDNRYLAFRAHFSEDQHLKIVRLQGTDPIVEARWIAVGSAERDLRPAGWSPDGRLLYLLSARDGYRCLYAQRIDPESGRPEGEATAVHHFHATRWLTSVETSASTGPSSAIMPGAFLFDQTVVSSNIWIMR
jgi:Tol biopolymer transport system component